MNDATYVSLDNTREALVSAIKVKVRHARLAFFDDCPVSPIPAVNTAVQRISSIMIVGRNVVDVGPVRLRVLGNGNRESPCRQSQSVY